MIHSRDPVTYTGRPAHIILSYLLSRFFSTKIMHVLENVMIYPGKYRESRMVFLAKNIIIV